MDQSVPAPEGGATPTDLVSCLTCGNLEWRRGAVCPVCGAKNPLTTGLPPVHQFHDAVKHATSVTSGFLLGPALIYSGLALNAPILFLYLGPPATALGWFWSIMILWGGLPGVAQVRTLRRDKSLVVRKENMPEVFEGRAIPPWRAGSLLATLPNDERDSAKEED